MKRGYTSVCVESGVQPITKEGKELFQLMPWLEQKAERMSC